MKTKTTIKRVLDVLMTMGLLLAMGYQLWGEVAHEWIGAGMFVLFIAHHILNRNWYKRLLKGNYTPMAIFQLWINGLTLVAMVALMYSGIVLSRHVFVFLPIDNGLVLARRLHILGSYWGFLLMSLHLGMHWHMLWKAVTQKTGEKGRSKKSAVICFVLGLLLAGYGVIVLIKRNFLTYLFLQSEFVFLDYSESKILFYIDYLALMGLCIFVAHYTAKLFQKYRKK